MSVLALNDLDKARVERVRNHYTIAEPDHKTFRTRATEFYSLYRSLQDFRDQQRTEPDRDLVTRRAQREWGQELFIPMAFRTVETIVPRMLAHRPRMNPLPEDDVAVQNVENMRRLIGKQQEQIHYEVELQKVAKDGLIYGLGVQKTGWRTDKRAVAGIGPHPYEGWSSPVKVIHERGFDDPYAEWVDPFAFLWDPYGHSPETCDFLIHRIYRSSAYIEKMVAQRIWRANDWDPTCEWTLEDLLKSAAPHKEDEIQQDRRKVEGYNTSQTGPGRHEVWEDHDGSEVSVILNGEYPVLVGSNPIPDGTKPFQVFRPTIIGGRMVGIGEIEPIRDLQYELNTLRGQRVDAGTMALNRGYFFDEGLVNADDLQIGPNIGVPVNGDPRTALWPMQIADVPESAFQESAAIEGNIDSTVGINDQIAGGDAPQQTATGAQLVVQAASIRIQNKTMLMGQEIIIPAGEQWILLNQSRILSRKAIYVKDGLGVGLPPDLSQDGLWSKYEMGPEELQGLMFMQMDDGSTMAENVPQQRADVNQWMTLASMQGPSGPLFDPEKVGGKILENMGVKAGAQSYLAAQEPQLPASVVEQVVGQFGIRPDQFMQVLNQVEAQQQQQGQPQPQQGQPPGQTG